MYWQPSGEKDTGDHGYVGTTWVGDTQVTYVIAREEEGSGKYVVQRHVSGASEVITLGSYKNPRWGQAEADADAEIIQRKGF